MRAEGALGDSGFGRPWAALGIALVLHVADEALTGFLSVYNPTAEILRAEFPLIPIPVFTFKVWFSGLIAACAVQLLCSPFAFRGSAWLRPIAWLLAGIMMLNGLGHLAGTLAGRTFEQVRFARPMPGFYSSPLLIAASAWLAARLLRTRPARGGPGLFRGYRE